MGTDQQGSEQGEQDSALDQRVGALETGQQSLSGKIDQILGIISKPGSAGGDGGHKEQPTGIGEQIRAQLDERDRKDREAADAKGKDDRLAAAEARIEQLSEQKPADPLRKITRAMWGGQ